MVCLVSRWLRRRWILVGDGAYACMDLAITCIKLNVALISRLRLDAQLYDRKGVLTFSDIIATAKRSIWANKYFSKSENQLDLDKCSKESIDSLIYQLTLAA